MMYRKKLHTLELRRHRRLARLRFWPQAMLVALSLFATSAVQAGEPVKIGVLTDMSGPTADLVGRGSVAAAEMAASDFGGQVLGQTIEIVSADHQYKPDVASSIVRRWFDVDGVDAVADVTVSAIALAVQGIAHEKSKIALISGAGSLDLFGKACSPTGFVWTFDTDVMPKAVVLGAAKAGLKKWFFITPDYSFGKQMVSASTKYLNGIGGEVSGVIRTPIGTADFAAALSMAMGSGANAVGLAVGGHDLINVVKQAAEFGIQDRGIRLVPFFATITDVDAIGLGAMHGAELATAFYWDLDDDTRNFGRRFFERMHRYPNMLQAGVYSSVTHYLKAVKAAGTKDALRVAAAMKEMPVDDLTTKAAFVRSDGRVVRDMYLVKVKEPAASKYPWDYYEILERIPGLSLLSKEPSADCQMAPK
jgi:branched-chain amino acid transport system substrate-binding protein